MPVTSVLGEIMNRPIQYCYWVFPGQLLAGEYPRNKDAESSIQKINALIQAGITAFIDLTQVRDNLLPYAGILDDISYQRFPIRDVSVPESIELMREILDAIDHHISQGRMVYVHCWGGIGRTGTVVGCWLARHGLEGRTAYDRLQELWEHNPKSAYRRSPETLEQKQYILDWRER